MENINRFKGPNAKQEVDKYLSTLFKDDIEPQLLIIIKNKVCELFKPYINTYFNVNLNEFNYITKTMDGYEYEVCKTIAGLHKSYTLFMSREDLLHLINTKEYRIKLVEDTINCLKLRNYSAKYFTKKPLFNGDEFLYFGVPYLTYAMCVKMSEIYTRNPGDINKPYVWFYDHIVHKSLSALTLLSNNLLADTYPLCRGTIEVFIKLMSLKSAPNLTETYNEYCKFAQFDLIKNMQHHYSDEFNEKYENRLDKTENNRIDFLHFGYVDKISDYKSLIKDNLYSLPSVFDYVTIKQNDESYKNLRYLYNECNGYTHGTINQSRYHLLHYFEIAIILSIIVTRTYKMVCSDFNESTLIEGVDVLKMMNDYQSKLIQQYRSKSEDKFKKYYNL